MSRRGWLLFLVMGVIWGVPYLFIKIAVEYFSPASLVFLRTAAAALLLVPVAIARRQLWPALARWRPLLAYTAAELAIPWFLLNTAEQRLSSSLAGLLLAAVPLVGALLGWFSRTDRLDWRRALGLLIGIGGVAALVGLDLGAGDIWALLAMLIVAVGYAVGPFILARSLTDVPALGVVAASLLITAVVYAVPAGLQLPRHRPPASAVIAVVVLAVVCTVAAFLLFFKLVEEVGSTRATVITYLNPAVAIALGVVFRHEPFTTGIVVGFALVLLGSALATRQSRPRGGAQPAGVEPGGVEPAGIGPAGVEPAGEAAEAAP
jgi:drug/metabolite transporter (DMT)-like permease